MGYFKSKKGSLEDEVNKLSKFATESGYQKMFKKELEKAGKRLGQDDKDMPEQKGLMAPPQPKEEEMI